MDTIIPEFEKQYPNIHVDAVRMPYDGLMQQIITSLSSGTGPDLMRMDIIWVPELAEMGALAAVDDLEGFADLKDNLYEGPLSTNYYNGKYYGLPLNTNCLSGVYSKTMMEELNIDSIPTTYDEVVAIEGQAWLKSVSDRMRGGKLLGYGSIVSLFGRCLYQRGLYKSIWLYQQ